MSWTEDYLRDLWSSLFSSEVCWKVKDANSVIVGPLMMVERISAALRELGLNYVECLEQLKDCQKKCLSSEDQVNSLRDKLNEAQKPCEKCRVLTRDLSEARKRANDAQHQVTQIAKILIVRSSDNENNYENISPSKSPKRKRNCHRSKEDKDGEWVEVEDTSSPPLSVRPSQEEVVPENRLTSISPNRWSRVSPSTKSSTFINGQNKKSSRSAFNNQEFSQYKNSRRNLSSDFKDIWHSPAEKEKMNDRDVEKLSETREKSKNDSRKFAESCGSQADAPQFKEDERRRDLGSSSQASIVESVVESVTMRTSTRAVVETRIFKADSECHRTRTDRRNPRSLTLNRSSTTKNPDNSYDLILERKKPKKRMKQLTLEMKLPVREERKDTIESDEDDIVSPSPTRGATVDRRSLSADEAELKEEELKPGATSTQLSVVATTPVTPDKPTSSHHSCPDKPTSSHHSCPDNSFDVPVVDKKRKPPSPNYMYQGKTVRGKARTNLPGWDCEDCKKFYQLAGKNLSPRKVKAKMNYCSKHRSKYKQTRPPTPPGFWDIDIPDTPE